MKFSIFILMFLLVSPIAFLNAQSGAPDDEAAIRAIEAHWEAAWNSHDAVALSKLLVPEVDFVNVNGLWIKGREKFLQLNTVSHRNIFKNSVRKNESVDIRFITPGIAIVHLYWNLRGDWDDSGKPRDTHRGIITRTEVKRAGQWLI